MATNIRPELSEKNKYWISKHRQYELKHFCLQYPQWQQTYAKLEDPSIPLYMIDRLPTGNLPGDPTAKRAEIKLYYSERINLIETLAKEVDPYLHDYILKAVTESLSYTYLKARLGIPCSRDIYYDRYRKFFWLLDQARD